MHQVAKRYLAAGLCVVPTRTDKRPALPTWTIFQKQLPTQDEVDEWFATATPHGIGIICGIISGGLEALDLDAKNDPAGTLNRRAEAAIRQFAPGVWERLPIEQTPSGGLHLYFRSPMPEGNLKLAHCPDAQGKLAVIAETRGEGGFIVSSPSPGYKMQHGSLSTIPLLTVEERDGLLSAARSLDQAPAKPSHQSSAISHWNRSELSPLDDFNKRGEVLELLRRHGWHIGPTRDDGSCYLRRPGKTEGGSATWNFAGRRTLCVFSTSTPFEVSPTTYSPAGVYAVLEHGGDYSAAAQELRRQGFGSGRERPFSQCKRDETNTPDRNKTDGEILILPGGGVSITDAAESIFAKIGSRRGLFFRGGRVHDIAVNPDCSRRLDPITPARFRSRLEEYGRVCAWRAGANGESVLKPTLCPEETARALLESRAAGEFLPHVSSLSACPVIARIGDELEVLGPGWHPLGGGLLVTGGSEPPTVPLPDAANALADLVQDFDFASPGDRSRALAAVVAPALQFGLSLKTRLPVDIGEADASQSGRTYRQKVIAAIYRETCNVVVQRSGGVGGLDEALSQKLIDGRPFILLDNLRGKLDSPFLEAILTAPGTMPARVPHRGEVQVDTRGLVFQVTSNGAETTRDLANRSSLIRIRKRPLGYKFHTYPEGDLHAHVVANQPYYLGCVFAVITEWVRQGRLRTSEYRHDFREWAQVCDWIVRHIFQAAPLLNGYEEAHQRISDPRRTWLRNICLALRESEKLGQDLGATSLAEFGIEQDLIPPNARPDADESNMARAIGKVMTAIFGNADQIEADGYTIRRGRRYSASAEKNIPVYTFVTTSCTGPAKPANPANAANAHNF
jgi:hypothetical protein